jgi:hypothetical protein
MPFARSARLLALAISLSAAACGGAPPDKEMHDAQQAIDRARAAGADRYAGEEYAGAVDALKDATAAVEQRDFRLALSRALDSRERAEAAAAEASNKVVAARAEAENGLLTARASLGRTQSKLKTVESGRVPAAAVSASRESIATAEQHLQEARKAFDKTDYLGASTATVAAMQAISTADAALDALLPPAARRRR